MSSGGTETPSPALAGRAPSCRLSCPETLAPASQGVSVSDFRSQPTPELSLGLNYNLPLLGLLMSCTTDVPWPGRQMGFSFLHELASWTQGWVWVGRISHGQREHGGTFSPKRCSTLGLDYQLAHLNVHIGQDGFQMGREQRHQQGGDWAGRHLCFGSKGRLRTIIFLLSLSQVFYQTQQPGFDSSHTSQDPGSS